MRASIDASGGIMGPSGGTRSTAASWGCPPEPPEPPPPLPPRPPTPPPAPARGPAAAPARVEVGHERAARGHNRNCNQPSHLTALLHLKTQWRALLTGRRIDHTSAIVTYPVAQAREGGRHARDAHGRAVAHGRAGRAERDLRVLAAVAAPAPGRATIIRARVAVVAQGIGRRVRAADHR